jgi:hypothetical protein
MIGTHKKKLKKATLKKYYNLDQRPTTRSTHKKSKLKKSHLKNITRRPKTKD